MFSSTTLKDLYTIFLTQDGNPFEHKNVLDHITIGIKTYQREILQMLETAIADENTTKLRFCIAAAFRDGIDSSYSDSFFKVILATWHEDHKDLVDAICFLRDEKFCEPLLQIALNKIPYRKFDDDFEVTLRKCVNTLKAINTAKSDAAIKQLLATNNQNVEEALLQYTETNACRDATL